MRKTNPQNKAAKPLEVKPPESFVDELVEPIPLHLPSTTFFWDEEILYEDESDIMVVLNGRIE